MKDTEKQQAWPNKPCGSLLELIFSAVFAVCVKELTPDTVVTQWEICSFPLVDLTPILSLQLTK